ncbi:hypothetical protein ACH5RR_030024 [Cinchona calisaya]|uniref:Uncharacterized protein n=1 Tax=Cinchona calisaya TaxID=153742 RepID=A0ABD2YUL8_9GENT
MQGVKNAKNGFDQAKMMNNNVGNGGKKGNHQANQTVGTKGNGNPGGIDQKTMQVLKERKMGNDIKSMMNLAGFHCNNGANNFASILGGNNATTSHQVLPNGFMGSSALAAGFPTIGMTTGHHPSAATAAAAAMTMNMNGSNGYNQQQLQYNNPSMLTNLQNRHAMQQPQMMYNRPPCIPTSTGYYYSSYGPPAALPPYHLNTCMNTTTDPSYYYNNNYDADQSASTHMFNDENTSSCSIM